MTDSHFDYFFQLGGFTLFLEVDFNLELEMSEEPLRLWSTNSVNHSMTKNVLRHG